VIVRYMQYSSSDMLSSSISFYTFFLKKLQAKFHPEDGGSMHLWNTGILPQYYMASQPRRPQLETLCCESLKTHI